MSRLAKLWSAAKKLHPPTEREKQISRFSYAYGNLACSTNHKPTLAAFAAMAKSEGWSAEEFKDWAKDLEWWVR